MRGTHGYASGKKLTLTYRIWRSMKDRCSNPKARAFARYGERGIAVDPRWSKFEHFLADMGECPPDYSLERLHIDRNYWRGNCIWIPLARQADNRSNTKLITYRCRTMTIPQWAEELGMRATTIRSRVNKGWPLEDVLHKPVFI